MGGRWINRQGDQGGGGGGGAKGYVGPAPSKIIASLL